MEGRCVFCGGESEEPENGGELIVKAELSVHKYCLYFASGLAQRGGEDNGDAISGFLLEDIRAEMRRSALLKCAVCGRKGASIGCAVKRCRNMGHYSCLRSRDYLFHHFGNFEAFCPHHRPRQRQGQAIHQQQRECSVCLTAISSQPEFSQICCPQCKTLFHRDCIQRQGLSAGRHYMRCPVCNDKEHYVEEMLKMGIDIPERDAEWELTGQFVEDVDVNKYCHADKCLCPPELGKRKHHSAIGQYKMRKCLSCGQWLGHVLCLKGQPEQCTDCAAVPMRTPSIYSQTERPSPSIYPPSSSSNYPPSISSSETSSGDHSRSMYPQSSPRSVQSPLSLKRRGSPIARDPLSLKRQGSPIARDPLSLKRQGSPIARDPLSLKRRGSPGDHQKKQRSHTSLVSSLASEYSTIRSQRVDEQLNQCNCRICVARGFFQGSSVNSDSGDQSLVVSVPRHVLQASTTSTAATSLVVPIPLKKLHSKGTFLTSSRHTTHPALTALLQRHRHRGMKLLKSVSLSRVSLK